MEKLIDIWCNFGYGVYWIFWLGSVAFFDVSIKNGIGIGALSVVGWLVVLQVFIFIEYGCWFWEE